MFSSLLVVVAVGALMYSVKRWQSLPEADRASFTKKAFIYGAAGAILALVLTGRAHWLMGILAALLGLAGRAAQFAQYIPVFKKFMGDDVMGDQKGRTQEGSATVTQTEMSKQGAADILGVDLNSGQDDIRLAHKRLMQKNHPDRGGSNAIAKQINQAKDVLLS